LQHASSRGIVHRDIAEQHVLIKTRWATVVKILDWPRQVRREDVDNNRSRKRAG
jgi:RIO-like serine/threonine protein kinase